MDMSLNKLQEIVKAREAWRPAVRGVAKSQHDLATNKQQQSKETLFQFANWELNLLHSEESQNMPCPLIPNYSTYRHKDYFELKAIKNQQMQEEYSSLP